MKIVDMSHVMNVHSPGRVAYAGHKTRCAQNVQMQTIAARRLDTAPRVGSRFDGAVQAPDNPKHPLSSAAGG